MTPERDATVDSIGPQGITLRLDAQCHGCGGCRGRCSLVGPLNAAGDLFELPLRSIDGSVTPGLRVRIRLDDAVLLQQARVGYGLPLLGLVVFAGIAHGLAGWLNLAQDVPAAIAAAAGTLTGVVLSKRSMPPSLRIAALPADGSPTRMSNEDRTP